jgi:hypothetical protein
MPGEHAHSPAQRTRPWSIRFGRRQALFRDNDKARRTSRFGHLAWKPSPPAILAHARAADDFAAIRSSLCSGSMRKRPRRPHVGKLVSTAAAFLPGIASADASLFLISVRAMPQRASALLSRLDLRLKRGIVQRLAVPGASGQARLEDWAGDGTRAAPLGASGSSNWPIMVSGTGVEVP